MPDGEWFGTATPTDGLEFPCWFTREAAVPAAAEDNEESAPSNDYYVCKVNPQIRQVPVGDGLEVVYDHE